MKYIRKVMAIGLAIVFLIALVIGTGIILSVRNVNVTYIDYSGEYTEEYEKTRSNLGNLKGSGLIFLNEEDIAEKISVPQHIALEKFEKKFPCSVDVVLRERVETFTVKTAAGYSVFDERGKLLRAVADEEDALNLLDNCPNVILNAAVGQVEALAEICGYFNDSFGALRRLVEEVSLSRFLEREILTFSLRSGLEISVSDWTNNGRKKVQKAYDEYLRQPEENRVRGLIAVSDGRDGGGPVSIYSK